MFMETLRQIVDAQRAVDSAAESYWNTYIQPRANSCETIEQLNKLREEISRQCASTDGQIRNMPSLYAVYFAYAADAISARPTKKD